MQAAYSHLHFIDLRSNKKYTNLRSYQYAAAYRVENFEFLK